MADRPGDPVRNRATLAATKALAHACCGDRDEAVACAQTAEALYDLATTQDLLAEALRVGLEEREALRAERDAERLNATGFRLLLLGDYAALGRALGLGSAPLTIDQATEAARALLVERNALRAAIATQAAAVRQHDAAQATLRAADARDTATLRRREATPGDTLAELAAAREEARQWNARATELEAERDALRTRAEGRTTPPTDAEMLAHWRAGGWWVVLGADGQLRSECIRENTDVFRGARRIIAADRDGRPCAWPVVEGSRG